MKEFKCFTCGSLFFGKAYKERKYCSLRCLNSRLRSDEEREKTRNKLSGREIPPEEREKVLRANRNPEKLKLQKERLKKNRNENFEKLGKDAKRRAVIEHQEFKCLECNLSEWRGLPIILELDHIDGDHLNHSRDNYRALCPNCHSQTPTWRKKK